MHVLSYSWHAFKPSLICRENGEIKKIELSGEISFKILPEKICIGIRDFSGFGLCENPVPENRIQCPGCMEKDRILPCLKCEGVCAADKETGKFCLENEFCVYLALFGKRVKVGVSLEKRLVERLAEQGADYGLKIAFGNGLECRKIEKKIADLGVKSRMSYQSKIVCMTNPDINALKNTFMAAKEKIELLDSFQPINLTEHYPKINRRPKNIIVRPGTISGKILGAKGEILLLEPNCAVNLKAFISRVVERNTILR